MKAPIILALLFLVAMCGLSYAQTTPEELGKAIVEAINAKDEMALKALFHAKNLEDFENAGAEEWKKVSNLYLAKPTINEYKVSSSTFEDSIAAKGMTYDAETQTLSFFGIKTYASVTPSQAIQIDYEAEGVIAPLEFSIVEDNGRWYVVVFVRSG